MGAVQHVGGRAPSSAYDVAPLPCARRMPAHVFLSERRRPAFGKQWSHEIVIPPSTAATSITTAVTSSSIFCDLETSHNCLLHGCDAAAMTTTMANTCLTCSWKSHSRLNTYLYYFEVPHYTYSKMVPKTLF